MHRVGSHIVRRLRSGWWAPALGASLVGLGPFGCLPEGHAPAASFAPRLRSGASLELASVSLGRSTTCATTLAGESKCWGRADGGRLGLGWIPSTPLLADPLALDELELGGSAVSIATSGAQSFVILDDGRVRAFGTNSAGELGLPHQQTIGDDESPAGTESLVPLDGPAHQVATGQGFGCAALEDGRVQCWGRGDEGQLGSGPQPGSRPPTEVELYGAVVEVAAGSAHACARLSEGTVRCWGANDRGQLGRGSAPASSPISLPLAAVQIVAGGAHTCALLLDGAVHCWGDNSHGQLGYGHAQVIGDDETPAEAGPVSLGGPARMLAAGSQHGCALLDPGLVRCWGANASGQLGLEATHDIGDDELPCAVEALDFGEREALAIFGGSRAEHTCALLDDGALRCWGLNAHGQLGLGYVDPGNPVETPPGDLPDVLVVEDPDD